MDASAMTGKIPPPPPGFEFESQGRDSGIPSPPPGFQMEEPTFYDEYVGPGLETLGNVATGAYEYIVGKQDPKFKDLPAIDSPSGFDKNTPLTVDGVSRAQLVGMSDDQYRDILIKQLGKNYITTTKDSNGFDVIVYRGNDGNTYQRYVNKPGLDWQDVNRGITSSLPFMAAGGAVGAGAKAAGFGLLSRAGSQAAGAGITSLGQDVAAQGMGAKQAPSLLKAGMAAAGGAGGELLGALVSRLMSRNATNRALVDEAGNLTERGRKFVTDEGFDPDLIQGEMAQAFARLSKQATDPSEALMQVQTQQFGIPTTKGQRTKQQDFLIAEKDLRAGNLGKEPQEQMLQFDKAQREAIERAVRGQGFSGRSPYRTGDTELDGIPALLAPSRSSNSYIQNPSELGSGAKKGFDVAVDAAKKVENEAWKKTGNLTAKSGSQASIPQFVQKSVGNFRIVPDQQPQAAAMVKELQAFMEGKAPPTEFSEFLGQQSVTYIDEMRRTLLGYVRNASSINGDKAAAGKIYAGYMDWVSDTAAKGLLAGDTNGVKALREAIGATKEVRSLIKPTDPSGKSTVVARVFERIKGAETGEEVINSLLGAGGSKASFKVGGAAALKTYETLVKKYGGKLGEEAWNDVRLAYWIKLVSGKDGETLGPQALLGNIRSAMHNQKSVMETLYKPSEVRTIRKLVEALKVVNAPDPNPSGSGTVVRGIFPELAAQAAETQAKRELFSKHNVLMSRLYNSLAKTIRTPIVKPGSYVANRAKSQQITLRKSPSAGGYGSAIAGSSQEDR